MSQITLQNSYTVPMTLDEWVQCVPWLKEVPIADEIDKCAFVAFGDGTIAEKPRDGMVRVSVPRFLDLMHDRITPWRLEEAGFVLPGTSRCYEIQTDNKVVGVQLWDLSVYSMHPDDELNNHTFYEGITTFTDLLTLIRFLTPPSEKT